MRTQALTGIICLLMAACSGSKFSGDTKPAAKDNAADSQKDPTTSGDSKIPDGTPGESTGENDPTDPNTTTTDGITNNPSTNTVIFGGSGVYRVGDGAAQATSCKQTVFSFELEGSEYSFLFNVEQDNTKVSFKIGRLCGIDVDRSNRFSIVSLDENKVIDTFDLDRKVVEDGDSPFAPFRSDITLNKGKYAIRVESDFTRGPGSDRDDFVVGNIQVKADKPILGTEISTK